MMRRFTSAPKPSLREWVYIAFSPSAAAGDR